MAIRDVENLLWSAAALSADAASTNTYDLALTTNDISVGAEILCLVITVDVAAKVSGTTETYKFQVIQSASADLSTPTILVEVPFTNTQAATLLAAGKQIVVPIPPNSITQRYLGAYFDGANTPTITVTAYICGIQDVAIQKYPPRSYTVANP